MHKWLAIAFLVAPSALLIGSYDVRAAGIGSGQFGTSYMCGPASSTDPSRTCTCDKTEAGDCKLMADEVCVGETYICDVGSTECWCSEKRGGPSARTIDGNRTAPSSTVVAPSSVDPKPRVRRAPELAPMTKR